MRATQSATLTRAAGQRRRRRRRRGRRKCKSHTCTRARGTRQTIGFCMANKELTGRVAGCAARVGGEPSGQGRSATPAAAGANREARVAQQRPSPPPRGQLSLSSPPTPARPAPLLLFFRRLAWNLARRIVAAASSRLTSTSSAASSPLALTSCASLYYLFRLFLSTMLFYAHLLSRSLAPSVAYITPMSEFRFGHSFF